MANRVNYAPSHGGGFRAGQPSLLIVHSLEAPARRGLAWDLAAGWLKTAGVSPHTITDPGETVETLPDNIVGWHCGNGNQFGVGLEVTGYAAWSLEQWTTGDAWAALRLDAKRLAEFSSRLNIPLRWLSLAQINNGERGVCFTADTVILTRRGLVPADQVAVGDEVWTHQNRWRPVTATMSRDAELIEMKGQGHPGLRVTPEHPFLSRKSRYKGVADASTPTGRNVARIFSDSEWTEAGDMLGRSWMTPVLEGMGDIPTVDGHPLSTEDMWIVGRWVADGHTGSGRAYFSIGAHKEDDFLEHAAVSGFPFSSYISRPGPSCGQHRINSSVLETWLLENFGKYAHGKRVPSWLLFSHEKYRAAFLEGYLSGDGHVIARGGDRESSTASRHLAMGLRLLGSSLGYGVSMYRHKQRDTIIDGRAIHGRYDCWRVRFTDITRPRTGTAVRDGAMLGTVRSIKPAGRGTVYNISVADDESYIADGFIVHNCTHADITLSIGRGSTTHTDPGRGFPFEAFMRTAQQWQGGSGGGAGGNPNPKPEGGTGGAQPGDWVDTATVPELRTALAEALA